MSRYVCWTPTTCIIPCCHFKHFVLSVVITLAVLRCLCQPSKRARNTAQCCLVIQRNCLFLQFSQFSQKIYEVFLLCNIWGWWEGDWVPTPRPPSWGWVVPSAGLGWEQPVLARTERSRSPAGWAKWCQSVTIFRGTSRTPGCDKGALNIFGKAAEPYGVILDATVALIPFDFDLTEKPFHFLSCCCLILRYCMFIVGFFLFGWAQGSLEG